MTPNEALRASGKCPHRYVVNERREFDPPPDEDIRPCVEVLRHHGVETFGSCQSGPGHSSSEPVIRLEGNDYEGYRAPSMALAHGLPVAHLQQAWNVDKRILEGP